MFLPGFAAETGLPSAQTTKTPKPSFVTLTFGNGISQDMEIILCPDGGFLVPVKTLSALLDVSAQVLDEEHRLVFVDPVNKKRVDIDWGTQHIKVDDQPYSALKHPIVKVNNGFIVKDDVFVDQIFLQDILGLSLTYDNDTTTLSLNTKRKLKIAGQSNAESDTEDNDANITTIQKPDVYRALIEKAYIINTNNYSYQAAQQPVGIGSQQLNNNYIYALMDTPTVGISGSLFGQDYYLKPSFVHYNGKTTFQNIDWLVQHKTQNNLLTLGSANAGLSPLVSPDLNLWGLKFSSKNASTPYLTPSQSQEFSGKADAGNRVMLRLNERTVQTTAVKEGSYEFEPLYLQPQSINHIRIVETDENHQEKILVDKKFANFQNMLPAGETAYSTFVGRTPLQFYPLLPNQSTPLFMPQSEKWLAGGRFFYGVTDRFTVGLSAAADNIWGKPRTYFTALNPLALDLKGFSSYLRDPNFFNGENAALTLRYQLTDLWSLSTDTGISALRLKPGSLLSIPSSDFGKAAQIQLERNNRFFSYTLNAFHYDPYYYTPSTSLYGNPLYDKQGIGSGINGMLSKYVNLYYRLKWEHYQTNLERLIPGGAINADHWSGGLTSPLGKKSVLSLSGGWIDGSNRDKEFLQRSWDLSFQTQALPFGLKGEVRASHYFTNTIFLPSKILGTNLVQADYKNNSLEAVLDVPLSKSKQEHIKIGDHLSTYVDYGFAQGYFQFKHFFCEPVAQISYGNKPQTQNRVGLRVGYEFKSGAKLSVAYYKVINTFGASIPSLPHSTIKTDQFYMDFSDIIGIFAHKLHFLGPNANSVGTMTGKIFADYNQNNKWDRNEPGIPKVHLMADKQRLIKTDQNGYYTINGLSPSYHTLEVLSENLPLTLSSGNPVYRLKVAEGKTYTVNIALTPAGGALKGRVVLKDIQGKSIKPTTLILVLINDNKGARQVINYTSVDARGNYKFSNLAPGRYQIDLEQKIKESGKYKILSSPTSVELKIPKNYEDTSEMTDLDFKLLIL